MKFVPTAPSIPEIMYNCKEQNRNGEKKLKNKQTNKQTGNLITWISQKYKPVYNYTSAVVDTTFVDIYVDTKNMPTCRYNIQHIDKRTMENKMSTIMWEAAMSYATTFK